MAKAHTYKELGEQFLASNEIQLLGGMNLIMSSKDRHWRKDDCYQCRRDLLELNCDVFAVRLGDGSHVFCCAPCRDLTQKIDDRRIELRDAMKRSKANT